MNQIEYEIGEFSPYGKYVAFWFGTNELLGFYFLDRGENLEDFKNEIRQRGLLLGKTDLSFVEAKRKRFWEGDDFAFGFEGSELERAVWKVLMTIPRGQTRDYSWVAREAGYAGAVRAVASAVGRNHLAFIVPCHRVVRKDGGMGGYRFGVELKRRILEEESK